MDETKPEARLLGAYPREPPHPILLAIDGQHSYDEPPTGRATVGRRQNMLTLVNRRRHGVGDQQLSQGPHEAAVRSRSARGPPARTHRTRQSHNFEAKADWNSG